MIMQLLTLIPLLWNLAAAGTYTCSSIESPTTCNWWTELTGDCSCPCEETSYFPCLENGHDTYQTLVYSGSTECQLTVISEIENRFDDDERREILKQVMRFGMDALADSIPGGSLVTYLLYPLMDGNGEPAITTETLADQRNELLTCMTDMINKQDADEEQENAVDKARYLQEILEEMESSNSYVTALNDLNTFANQISTQYSFWESHYDDINMVINLLPAFVSMIDVIYISHVTYLGILYEDNDCDKYVETYDDFKTVMNVYHNWISKASTTFKNHFTPVLDCTEGEPTTSRTTITFHNGGYIYYDDSVVCAGAELHLHVENDSPFAAYDQHYEDMIGKSLDLTASIVEEISENYSCLRGDVPNTQIELYARGQNQDKIDDIMYSYIKVTGTDMNENNVYFYSKCYRGFLVAVLSENGDVNKGAYDTYGDYYRGRLTEQGDAIVDLLQNVQKGQLVLMTTFDSVDLETGQQTKNILNILSSWGCDVDIIQFRDSFVFVGYSHTTGHLETIYCEKSTRYNPAIKQTVELTKSIEITMYSRGNNQAKIDGYSNSYVRVTGHGYLGDINSAYSQSGRGFQIVVLDENYGSYIKKDTFDTYGDYYRGRTYEQGDEAVDFLNSIEAGQLVLITTKDTVDLNISARRSVKVLKVLNGWGCDVPSEGYLGHRDSFIYIGYAHQQTIYCMSSTRYESAIKESFTLT